MVAVGAALMSVVPSMRTALPCRFWNPQRERKPQPSREKHCTTTCSIAKDPPTLLWDHNQQRPQATKSGTPLPWLLPCLVGSHSRKRCHGCERVSVPQMVAVGLAVMSVAPIGATPLPWLLPCRFWNPQRETSQQRERNPQQISNRNAFALGVAAS